MFRVLILASLTSFLMQSAASAADEPPTYPLWPDGAPKAEGTETGNRNNPGDVPTITVCLAPSDRATGASVVICPGGGYGFLAVDHEGYEVAEWLNSLGITGVILKYRLGPKYHHPVELGDVQRAIRTVRARSKEWGLDPHRVAVLGFSAGGHLASTVTTHYDSGNPDAKDPIDRESCRPDRAILVYPVVSLETEYAHAGSRRNLLGENPSGDLVHSLSNETQVTKDTPPVFLAHTNEDTGVPPENSIYFVLALRKAGVPVEFHLFEKGQHGLGLGSGSKEHKIAPNPAFQAWPGLCAIWLKNQGFCDRPAANP